MTRAGEPTTLPTTTRSAPSRLAKRTTVSRETSIAGVSPAARHAPSTAPASTERALESSASRVESSSTIPSRRNASDGSAPVTRNGATTTRWGTANRSTVGVRSGRARPISTPVPMSAIMTAERIAQRTQIGTVTSVIGRGTVARCQLDTGCSPAPASSGGRASTDGTTTASPIDSRASVAVRSALGGASIAVSADGSSPRGAPSRRRSARASTTGSGSNSIS